MRRLLRPQPWIHEDPRDLESVYKQQLNPIRAAKTTQYAPMAANDNASSISVCIRVRPFTVRFPLSTAGSLLLTAEQVREAAQLSHVPDGPLFLGDGSLAGVPTQKLSQKGIRSVIKVVDDKCL